MTVTDHKAPECLLKREIQKHPIKPNHRSKKTTTELSHSGHFDTDVTNNTNLAVFNLHGPDPGLWYCARWLAGTAFRDPYNETKPSLTLLVPPVLLPRTRRMKMSGQIVALYCSLLSNELVNITAILRISCRCFNCHRVQIVVSACVSHYGLQQKNRSSGKQAEKKTQQ